MLILLFNCNLNQKRLCEDFKTGKYKSVVKIDNIEYTSIFTRNDSIQVEIFNNVVDSTNVRWINNCEVVFTTINPKTIQQKKPILVKILRTYEKSYDFEYSYVGETKKQQGKAEILE
jgi:hypothetical protein|tara:strand:+ start:573 stop:923 length:351 start_codon:yes stop_codon:yes gene_type:complete